MALTDAAKKELMNQINLLMKEFCPPLQVSKEGPGGLELMGNVPTAYGSRKVMVPGMYFASTAIRKSSVVFYFFPAYMEVEVFKEKAPKTWSLLQGKTCFHFRKPEDLVRKEIQALFKLGISGYKKNGWIK